MLCKHKKLSWMESDFKMWLIRIKAVLEMFIPVDATTCGSYELV